MAKPGRLVELSVRMPSIVDVEGMVEIVSHPIAKPFHHVFESLHTVALWKEMFILDNVFDFDIPNKLEGDRQKGPRDHASQLGGDQAMLTPAGVRGTVSENASRRTAQENVSKGVFRSAIVYSRAYVRMPAVVGYRRALIVSTVRSGYVSQNHAVYTISSDVQGIGFGIDLDVSFQIEVVGRTGSCVCTVCDRYLTLTLETSSSVVVAVKPNVKRVPFWGLSRLVHQAIVDETAAVFGNLPVVILRVLESEPLPASPRRQPGT